MSRDGSDDKTIIRLEWNMILVSIVGDSLSTFEGFNPSGYAVYYDAYMQQENGLSSVYDTWWAKVNQAMHAYLCVNNSYSGSKVTGENFPAASSVERISCLRTAENSPDIILVYIGFNDFGNGVSIRKNKFKINTDLSCFEDAYAIMIDRIKEQYPQAKVVCGTLMRTWIRNDETWIFPERFAGEIFEDYNKAIRRIAKRKRVYLADLGSFDIRYETLDGTHPTMEGHQTIANVWIKCLASLDLIKPSTTH